MNGKYTLNVSGTNDLGTTDMLYSTQFYVNGRSCDSHVMCYMCHVIVSIVHVNGSRGGSRLKE